jgi:hypothetical protein
MYLEDANMNMTISTETVGKLRAGFTAWIQRYGPLIAPEELKYSIMDHGRRREGLAAVRVWIECGGDPAAASEYTTSTILSVAACYVEIDVVRFLLENGADVFRATEALSACCMSGLFTPVSFQIVTALLDHGADINYFVENSYNGFRCKSATPLMRAAWNGRRKLIHLLLRRGAQNLVNSEGRGPVWCALDERGIGSPDIADLFDAVDRAGSYTAYHREPRVRVLVLRALCEVNRATPPADDVLRRVISLPREVFWLVIQYWHTELDDEPVDNVDEPKDNGDY